MLARGEDRFGNFIHVPPASADFTPETIAIYDEIRLEQSAVMMKGANGKTEMYA